MMMYHHFEGSQTLIRTIKSVSEHSHTSATMFVEDSFSYMLVAHTFYKAHQNMDFQTL